MNSETKTLFEKLIEEVSNPEWWTIILTIINIVAFVFVAYTQICLQKQQTKLQKQQAKAQEYELYLRLYKIVMEMDRLIKEHIETSLLYYGPFRNKAFKPFAEKESEVSNCIAKFKGCQIDFELKFPKEKDVIDKYESVITGIQLVYHWLNNRAIFEKEDGRDFRKLLMRCRRINSDDDYELKKELISLLKGKTVKQSIDERLSKFLEDKEYLEKSNFLNKIAERCKPE